MQFSDQDAHWRNASLKSTSVPICSNVGEYTMRATTNIPKKHRANNVSETRRECQDCAITYYLLNECFNSNYVFLLGEKILIPGDVQIYLESLSARYVNGRHRACRYFRKVRYFLKKIFQSWQVAYDRDHMQHNNRFLTNLNLKWL